MDPGDQQQWHSTHTRIGYTTSKQERARCIGAIADTYVNAVRLTTHSKNLLNQQSDTDALKTHSKNLLNQ